MTDRAALTASLPTGPRQPVLRTPPRHPDSVRRTTALDLGWSDPGQPQVVTASGRDLLTDATGTAQVLNEEHVTITVGGDDIVTSADAGSAHDLSGLLGAPARSGFRGWVTEVLADHRHGGTLLHQLLDDLPLALLIANYGLTREHPEWEIPPEATARLTDLCAGWAQEGTMLVALTRSGTFPVPIGPPAPPLDSPADPLGWHHLDDLPPRAVRRVRRLDLVQGDPLTLEVYFRDSHRGADGKADVLHEYTLDATVDPRTLEVTSAAARAHTLPWPECPGALASASRVVGVRVHVLPDLVAADFVGTSTCTHLNDLLRSMSGVGCMVEALR